MSWHKFQALEHSTIFDPEPWNWSGFPFIFVGPSSLKIDVLSYCYRDSELPKHSMSKNRTAILRWSELKLLIPLEDIKAQEHYLYWVIGLKMEVQYNTNRSDHQLLNKFQYTSWRSFLLHGERVRWWYSKWFALVKYGFFEVWDFQVESSIWMLIQAYLDKSYQVMTLMQTYFNLTLVHKISIIKIGKKKCLLPLV